MTESSGKLERELHAMRPKPLSGETFDALALAMSRKGSRRGDWCLIGAMGSGLAAAVVIVAMLSLGLNGPPAGASVPVVAPVAQVVPERAGDSLVMFARADAGWNGILK